MLLCYIYLFIYLFVSLCVLFVIYLCIDVFIMYLCIVGGVLFQWASRGDSGGRGSHDYKATSLTNSFSLQYHSKLPTKLVVHAVDDN